MLKPYKQAKVIRKQISVYKFNRVKEMPSSKRVRLFLTLRPYEMQVAEDAYELDGFYYVCHGNMVDVGFEQKYRTHYFRYEPTTALYSPHSLRKV